MILVLTSELTFASESSLSKLNSNSVNAFENLSLKDFPAFVKFNHYIVLFFNSFLVKENEKIIDMFLKNIKEIPNGFISYFLHGDANKIPSISLLKKMLLKTYNDETNKYVISAINCLIYKPEYINRYSNIDYSIPRKMLIILKLQII